jgi:large subunit ribosomal protein L25
MAQMKATSRKESGSRQVKKLRDKGLTPAIIYGHGEKPVPVTLSEHDLELALQHGERLLEVSVDGDAQNVLVKDVQYDTFGHFVQHVDLLRVSLTERVEVEVQVILRGTPKGIADGGVLNQIAPGIRVECSVASIPEDIRIMVTELGLNESLHLRDIELAEGVKLLDDPDALLCTCAEVAEEGEPEEGEEETAEPEVIGAKKEEEQEESAE